MSLAAEAQSRGMGRVSLGRCVRRVRPLNAELRHHYLSNSLRVSAGITPRLAKLIESVVENLKFGVRLESFIFADSHPNAFCAPAPNAEYAYIMISSELVNLMSLFDDTGGSVTAVYAQQDLLALQVR